MTDEIHLLVLWARARKAEARILADIPRHVDIVTTLELAWPGRAEKGFQEFYGTYLPDPRRKVRDAGAGAFLVVVVRDRKPRYAFRRTERGMERLNERIYQMKRRYRNWIGGSHIVHATNSVEEACHDLWLLTGICYDDWASGAWRERAPRVIAGRKGWDSLREAFQTLNVCIPYVVLRGWTYLPDGYDRARDTDIDILAADYRNAAWLLHARKVYPKLLKRPHYEITVAGQPVRLDIRSIGDGYYDTAWQRDILQNRCLLPQGFYVPEGEDAFYSLAYHAILQKRVATPNLDKVFAEAAMRGLGADVASCLTALRHYMAAHGYGFARPSDATVYFNRALAGSVALAAEARDLIGIKVLRPAMLPDEVDETFAVLPRFAFTGELDGITRHVEYAPCPSDTFDTQFRAMQAFYAHAPSHALRPVTWRLAPSGAFLVCEAIDAKPLKPEEVSAQDADRIAAAFLEIESALREADIVHRAISPRNILVTADRRVVLAGFGFAVLRGAYKKEKRFVRRHFTALLERLGGAYALEPGRWSDAYSLAAILARLPQTPGVKSAALFLAKGADASLVVHAPVREKIKACGRWLKLKLQCACRRRVSEKLRARLKFARNVLKGARA